LLHKGENKLRGGIGELGNLGKNGPRLYSTYNITIVKCGAFDFRFNFLISGPSLEFTLKFLLSFDIILKCK
jgi:hypothetical protein